MNQHTVDDVRAFPDVWAAAERAGDAAATARLLTDDFAGIGPVGYVLPKDAWPARHADGLRFIAGTPGAPGPASS